MVRPPASLLLVTALAAGVAAGQDARISTAVDTASIRVGEQVRVTVRVEHPPGTVVRNVGPSDSLRGLEIVRVDSAGPLTRVFIVTSFDTGTHVLPPFAAWYGAASDTVVRSVAGAPVAITVAGVDVDTSAEIRAIKPPLGAPLTFAEVLPYLLGAAAAALLGWLLHHWWRKRKRGERLIPEPPPRPAHELALEALRSIESERLWQRGLVKEFHSALSDVLRTYIERRFGTLAMESTSDEILASAPVVAQSPAAVSALRDVLTRSDLVKFAKFIPPPEHNERSLAESVSFVELTGRVPDAAAADDGGSAADGASRGEPAGPREGAVA